LKANFREEFFAASMTLDMGNTDKLAMFASEARKSGIRMLPPCVNQSGVDFGVERPKDEGQPGAIRYSLAALKNIGAGAVESAVNERNSGGPFASLADFAARVDAKAFNRRAIETLAKGGAFDTFNDNRALVSANADTILASAQRRSADEAQGITDLFGSGGKPAELVLRSVDGWTPMDRLSAEFEAIGFYLSGHPLDQYDRVLAKLGVKKFSEFEVLTQRGATAGRLAGVVIAARERRSQKGNKFAFAMFSDATGQFEAVIFSDTLAVSRELLEPGTPVIVSVEAERDGDTLKMRAQSIEALDKAAAGVPRNLKLVLDHRQCAKSGAERLPEISNRLKPASKGGEVRIVLPLIEHGCEMEFVLPGRYDVSPQEAGRFASLAIVAEVVEL
jgi:DNA polymerase-3 subunit alpha